MASTVTQAGTARRAPSCAGTNFHPRIACTARSSRPNPIPLTSAYLQSAPVRTHEHLQCHCSLHFGLARLIRVLRIRAIRAPRQRNDICIGATVRLALAGIWSFIISHAAIEASAEAMILARPSRVRIGLHSRNPQIGDRRRKLRCARIKYRCRNEQCGFRIGNSARRNERHRGSWGEGSMARWSRIFFSAAALFSQSRVPKLIVFWRRRKSEWPVGDSLVPRFCELVQVRGKIQQKNSHDHRRVCEQRYHSRATRVCCAPDCKEMQRRAVRRRRNNSRGRQQLPKVIPHTLHPGITRILHTTEGTRQRIAHGQASAPASILVRLLDETGCERVMRSPAPWIGCPHEQRWFGIC